jgi:hypothetical protein
MTVARQTPVGPNPQFLAKKIDKGMLIAADASERTSCMFIAPMPASIVA